MSATHCPVHGVEWKLVPAGTSKSTGKPYAAFWACPERGCREKPAAAPAAPQPARTPSQTTPAPQARPEPSSGASPLLLLLLGAMDMAGKVFQASENDIAARTMAADLVQEWKDKL